MSLRMEIRDAIDQVTPPAPMLQTKVEAFVSSNAQGRFRPIAEARNRSTMALGNSLAMVAVLLIIAVVAAVLLGGRLTQDWNNLHRAAPAGQSTYQAMVAELEARPLHIATFKSLADCKTGPIYGGPGGGWGNGPVYLHGGPSAATAWGTYYYLYFFANSPVTGPVVIRAIHPVSQKPLVFVGPYAAGPVVGTDTLDGKRVTQHAEAIIDTARAPQTPGPEWLLKYEANPYRARWPMIAGEAEPDSGESSSGWQVDGPGFSTTFVAC